MAFANMLGMGGSAVASMALGEKNEKRVRNVSSFVFFASIAIGLACMAVLMIFMRPILSLFGANSDTYAFARGYTFHISYGAPFIIWSAASSFILRVEGASKEAMIGNMIGTITNIVLDPLFISGFGMGAAGAAIATTIGNVLACFYYLWYYLKKSRILSIRPSDFTCRNRILPRVCLTGLPTAIFSALMSIYTIVMNQILVAYMLSGPFIGLLFVNMNCLQSTEHALLATVLSVLRQGVLLIPLLYLLNSVFGLNGVIYGQAITDCVTVVLSIILWSRIRKRL